jgi:predicted adenylyl cyclase CyaB
MPNIEIKAICHDLGKARSIADHLKTAYLGHLHQVDTYYETKKGRLKLREINNEKAQLIPYYKDYSFGPMKSNYSLLPVEKIKETKEILNEILGTITIVDKKREVFFIDNIRIHLDQVKDLGSFIEFEAVYDEETESKKFQEKKVSQLISKFNIAEKDLLDKSYIDYLTKPSDV